MLNLTLPREAEGAIHAALTRAGSREIGGILMAEHVGLDTFTVREITIQKRGTFASFLRSIDDALGRLRQFFNRTNRDYRRFNYIGEWHSHPSFSPIPSFKDDRSMFEIVQDKAVGANFAALLIVKLDSTGNLTGTLHTYFPDGRKERSNLNLGERQ